MTPKSTNMRCLKHLNPQLDLLSNRHRRTARRLAALQRWPRLCQHFQACPERSRRLWLRRNSPAVVLQASYAWRPADVLGKYWKTAEDGHGQRRLSYSPFSSRVTMVPRCVAMHAALLTATSVLQNN